MIDRKITKGRIVFRQSDRWPAWVDMGWIGVATDVRGKQITFDRRVGDPQDGNRVESRKMLVWKVAAVCDTQEEVEHILDLNAKIIGMREKCEAEIKSLLSPIN